MEPFLLKPGNEGKYISLVCAKLFNETTLPHVIRQSSRGRTHLLPRFFIPLHPSYFIPQLRPLAVNHSVLLKSSHRKILSNSIFGEWKSFLDVFFIFLPQTAVCECRLHYCIPGPHMISVQISRFWWRRWMYKIGMFSTFTIQARGKAEYVT